ncbi:MAG: response regulator [Polyangiales bacterium]
MTEPAFIERLRVLVVDDEQHARAKVVRLLRHDPRFETVGEARDGVEALAQIERLRPDLLVLDIQMPGLNGFELLDALEGDASLSVVFATASDRHALRAFDTHAVDYLLKPYDAERFAHALDKAYRQCAGGALGPPPELIRSALGVRRAHIALRTVDGAWVQLASDDIVRLSADNKHVAVTTTSTKYVVRQALRELSARLDARFVRVHRGDVVNAAHVTKLEPWDHGDAVATLSDGSSVIVTRTFRKALLAQLGLIRP